MKILVYTAMVLVISIIIYLLVMGDSKNDKKRTKQIFDLDGKEVDKENIISELIQKIPFYKTQKQLDQLGNLFKLKPLSYLLIKFLMAVLVFFSIMKRFNSIILGILATPVGFFFLDFLYNRSNRNDLDLIRLDFADIDNLLILKKKTGVVIGKALSEIYKSARKSKRLRNALLIMAAQINITGRVDEALNDFEDKFNFKETSDFARCIKSSIDTGLIEEELEGHARSINRDKRLYQKSKVRQIDTVVMIAGLLIFFGVSALILSTILADLGSGASSMFNS